MPRHLPLCSNTRRAISTRAATLPVSSCLRLFPVVAFCGFLWPFVASCCLLLPFEACCGVEPHHRNLSRVSPIVPICPHLSDSVRFCPGNNFFQFGSPRCTRVFLTFSCFEAP